MASAKTGILEYFTTDRRQPGPEQATVQFDRKSLAIARPVALNAPVDIQGRAEQPKLRLDGRARQLVDMGVVTFAEVQ